MELSGDLYFCSRRFRFSCLSDNANGEVVADAIKFESGVRASYVPNVIGDNATYGFYATGHNINCLSCHDADKRHIDGNPNTYEVDEIPQRW